MEAEADPRPRLRALVAACVLALLGACKTPLADPTENAPLFPSTTVDCDKKAPGLLAPASRGVADSIRAPHTASSLSVSRLTRIDRSTPARPLVDLRIDALDAAGNMAQMGGDVRVILKARSEPCYLVFDVAMARRIDAELRLDPTLGQYVLRLAPEWSREPSLGDDIGIVLSLTTLDGKILETESTLVWE